jgi:hypothetical protein
MEAEALNTETALLITTAIMALGAITFSSLTMAFQRSHNIKSVKPLCNIHKSVTDSEMSISIQNAGMGPMLIKKIVLLISPDDPIETSLTLSHALSDELNCEVFVHNMDGYVLASLFEVKLFQYSADTSDNGAMTLLKNKLNNYFLCIEFEDIYDHSYVKIEKPNL